MSVLEKYFDASLILNPAPIVKFIPKKSMVKCNLPIRLGSNGKSIPYTPSTNIYYTIFGDVPSDELNQLIFERKSMFSKHNSLNWYITTHKESMDKSDVDIICLYLSELDHKSKMGVIKHYDSDEGLETRKKLSEHMKSYSKILSRINSEKWDDPVWRENEMQRRHTTGFYSNMIGKMKEKHSDPVFKRYFIERVNSPERIEKIRKHTKECWKNEEYSKKVLGKAAKKNSIVSGVHMNSIEAKVAECLNSMGIEWEYEKTLKIDNNVYYPDFLIDGKIVLEIFGDYWHANPKVYCESDLIFSKVLSKDIWDKDAVRETNIKNAGFIFHKIWQSDVNSDNLEKILCDILKKN